MAKFFRSRLWQLPHSQTVRLFGNIEGAVALACTALIITAETQPGLEFDYPMAWILAWGLGIGSGIGALRFGGTFGKLTGGIAVGVLGLALIALLVKEVAGF
jgi:hypothetical protein